MTIANDNDKKLDTSKFRILDAGNGLYLEMEPTGKKVWWFKYNFDGRENFMSLGTYPEVSPEEAHHKKEKVRELLANNINPKKEKA